MEPLKKRTIIWEENNEPPKNYIWIKSDGKAYEYNNNTRSWELSKTMGSASNGTDSNASHVYEVSSLEDIQNPKEGDIAVIPDSWGELTIESTVTEDNGTITKVYNVESYSTNSRIKVTSDPTCFASSYVDSEYNSHNSGSVSTNVFPVGTKSITLWETGEFPEVHFYEEIPGATKEYVDGDWVDRSNLKKIQELEEEAKTHQAIVGLPATELIYDNAPNMDIDYNYPDGTIISFNSVFNKFPEENYIDDDLFIRYLENAYTLVNASVENCSTLILKANNTNKVFINVVSKSLPSPCGGSSYERNVVEITYASTYTPSGSDPVSESDVFDISYSIPSTFKINKNGHSLGYSVYSVEEVLPQGVENPVKISDCFEFVYGKETNGKIYEVFNKHLYEKEIGRKISDLVLKGYGTSSYWSYQVFQDCANGNYYGIIFADDNAFYSITYATYDGNGNGVIKFGNITVTMTDWSAIITTDNQ